MRADPAARPDLPEPTTCVATCRKTSQRTIHAGVFDMSHEINAILADPQAFGFGWVKQTVRVGGQGDKGTPFPDTPNLRVTDLAKFDAAFPGVVLASVNGTSLDVMGEGVGRNAREKGVRDPNEIKRRIVLRLLGVRAPATVLIYIGPDGERFTDEAAAKAAWLDFATK